MRVLIHTSINARGFLIDHLKNRLADLEREIGESVQIETPSHDHSISWLKESLKQGTLPDVMLCHASDLSVIDAPTRKKLFSGIARAYEKEHPIRKEFSAFSDPDGICYPLFIVPMVMFYNKKNGTADTLAGSWNDLFNLERKILFPDRDTPISKVVLAFLEKNYPDNYQAFLNRVAFGDSPVEVIQAVVVGKFDLAISNFSFSLMAKQRNIEINTATEGAIALPQIMLWKKGVSEKALLIADVYRDPMIHTYLGEQGFWPCLPDVPVGLFPPGSAVEKDWDGWDRFLEGIAKTEKEQ